MVRFWIWVVLMAGYLLLSISCQPQPYIPTEADLAADHELDQQIKEITDCIAEIMQPTDEELLLQTSEYLLAALHCADITLATQFATDTALGLFLYIDDAAINNYEIVSTDIYPLRGVTKVAINNSAQILTLVFKRKDKYDLWTLTSVK